MIFSPPRFLPPFYLCISILPHRISPFDRLYWTKLLLRRDELLFYELDANLGHYVLECYGPSHVFLRVPIAS